MFFKPNCCPPLSRNNNMNTEHNTHNLLGFNLMQKEKNAMRAHHLIQLVTKNDAWKLLLNIPDITVGLTIITPPTASKAKISKEPHSSFYRLTR